MFRLCGSRSKIILLQAFRDNHRIAVEDAQFASQLWQKCGLTDVAEGLSFEGCAAVGLNPNLRIYRYEGTGRINTESGSRACCMLCLVVAVRAPDPIIVLSLYYTRIDPIICFRMYHIVGNFAIISA